MREVVQGCVFLDLFFVGSPSADNGFKAFDYEKFCAMVILFCA